MDAIVKQAMAKWPNVPACYGWLALDSRGQWYMRDENAQRAGAFCSRVEGARGAPLTHPALVGFIQRNYGADAQGRWFFQNGPQRVYVELELAPLVLRLMDEGRVVTHCGHAVEGLALLEDELGHVFMRTNLGLGLVHTLDVEAVAQAIETGKLPTPVPVRLADLPEKEGFVLSPQAQLKAESTAG